MNKTIQSSARWQDSEKGEEWMDKTQEIEQEAENLESAIDSLKELS
jgi:hypothetical protein